MVLLWTLDIGNTKVESNLCPDDGNKENWSVVKMLQGHLEDIYDLCWSHDSNFIVTGSVDNSAIIWDVQKGADKKYLNYISVFAVRKMFLVFNALSQSVSL